jgi:hypothetical protein
MGYSSFNASFNNGHLQEHFFRLENNSPYICFKVRSSVLRFLSESIGSVQLFLRHFLPSMLFDSYLILMKVYSIQPI